MAGLASTHPPRLRPAPGSSAFAHLVESLIHQQVSLAAGRTILARLRQTCGGRITPERVLRQDEARLQAAGVSRQKRSYLLDLAGKVDSRELRLHRLGSAKNDEVIDQLTQVRGIGAWTAKMFLIFYLQRPDVVAPEDLGLRLAAARAYRLPMARTERFLERRAPVWSPYGSLACLTLWENKDAVAASGARKAQT